MEKAIKLYAESARGRDGDAGGQFFLGDCYDKGKGCDIDKKRARYYFKLAAKQGCVDAQYQLGLMYYDDDSTDVDLDEVLKWWGLAHAQGHELDGPSSLERINDKIRARDLDLAIDNPEFKE